MLYLTILLLNFDVERKETMMMGTKLKIASMFRNCVLAKAESTEDLLGNLGTFH